jgi:hypothetical protein
MEREGLPNLRLRVLLFLLFPSSSLSLGHFFSFISPFSQGVPTYHVMKERKCSLECSSMLKETIWSRFRNLTTALHFAEMRGNLN